MESRDDQENSSMSPDLVSSPDPTWGPHERWGLGPGSGVPRPHPIREGRSSPNSWIVPQNEEHPIRSLKDYVITFLSILYRPWIRTKLGQEFGLRAFPFA